MPLTIGPMHLSNTRRYEVQRTNNFEVVFEGLSEDVTLAVASSSMPNITNEPIEISHGNSKVKVAGQANFEDISLVVNDFIVADIEMQLYEWRKSVFDPETMKVGWAEKYKRNGRLYQYGPDGTVQRTWRLIGCFPTGFESSEMNYEGSDKKQVTLPISIDQAYPER